MYLIAMYKKPGVVQGVEFYFPNPDRDQEMKDPNFLGYFELLEAGDSKKFIREDRPEDIKPSSINDAICNLKKRIQDAITEGKDPSDEMLKEYLNLIREKKAKKRTMIAVVANDIQFISWVDERMTTPKYQNLKMSYNRERRTLSVIYPDKTEEVYVQAYSLHKTKGVEWGGIVVLDSMFDETNLKEWQIVQMGEIIAEVNRSIERNTVKTESSPVVKQAVQTDLSTDWEHGERFITYKFPVCAKNITPPTYTLKE